MNRGFELDDPYNFIENCMMLYFIYHKTGGGGEMILNSRCVM